MPNVGLKSVEAYLQKKYPDALRLDGTNTHLARHSGLTNVEWRLIASDAKRLSELKTSLVAGERTLAFVNTVDAAENVVEALAASGVEALPYHAKLSQAQRFKNLQVRVCVLVVVCRCAVIVCACEEE